MTTAIYLAASGIILCIALSAFFSGTEMAFSSCNMLRLENAMEDGDKRAKNAVYITEHFDDALSSILIGNNLVNIASSSLGSVLVIWATGGDEYAWLSTLIITLTVIIFGETIPKITAKKNANRLSLASAGAIRAMMFVFRPLIKVVVGIIGLLTRGMKGEENDDDAVEELQSIIETAEDEDVLDEERSELVQAAIDFSEISASEVMTARVDMQAINIEDDREDILAFVEQTEYSRIPVYEGSIDNIIGVLYVNRFLKALTEDDAVDLHELLMQPCYVYKTMKMPAVLSQLRKARQHLAIVCDEYGGTLGLVSMEDVLETIVGDIWDEKDTVEEEVRERAHGMYELDGDMTITDFTDLMAIDENNFEPESETVGGWAIETFGAFPRLGDSFRYENMEVTVLAMDGRRVEKLLVKVDNPEDGENPEKN